MKCKSFSMMVLMAALFALQTGCVERRVAYVPVYQAQPAVVQAPPAPTPVAPVAPTAPAPTTAPPLVTQAPPVAPVEMVPVAPGPGYVWTPGYYAWQGGWVWVRGCWVIRPHPHAVWIGGHWTRHGHGWLWVGGRWH